jgi:CheY-like chemotaxis protein
MVNKGGVDALRVLAVEDDPAFLELLRHAMDVLDEHFELVAVRDGLEALDVLQHAGQHGRPARPHIVLIDLKTPRMDGKELLAEMKSNASLRSIPAIVLSNSENPVDVDECYELQASSFMNKPVGFKNTVESVRRLHAYWRGTITLPDATH